MSRSLLFSVAMLASQTASYTASLTPTPRTIISLSSLHVVPSRMTLPLSVATSVDTRQPARGASLEFTTTRSRLVRGISVIGIVFAMQAILGVVVAMQLILLRCCVPLSWLSRRLVERPIVIAWLTAFLAAGPFLGLSEVWVRRAMSRQNKRILQVSSRISQRKRRRRRATSQQRAEQRDAISSDDFTSDEMSVGGLLLLLFIGVPALF